MAGNIVRELKSIKRMYYNPDSPRQDPQQASGSEEPRSEERASESLSPEQAKELKILDIKSLKKDNDLISKYKS